MNGFDVLSTFFSFGQRIEMDKHGKITENCLILLKETWLKVSNQLPTIFMEVIDRFLCCFKTKHTEYLERLYEKPPG